MSNSIRVKTTVNNVYDKLVELSSSLENEITVVEISDDKGSFEIKFGDMLNGFKYLVVSAFRNGDVVLVQTETYSKNPLMGTKQPIPVFQRKSANKFAKQVLDYLNEVTEEKTETVAEVKEKKVVKVNEIKKESKERVAEAIKEDASKNKSKSLDLLGWTIFIAIIVYIALPDNNSQSSNNYSQSSVSSSIMTLDDISNDVWSKSGWSEVKRENNGNGMYSLFHQMPNGAIVKTTTRVSSNGNAKILSTKVIR